MAARHQAARAILAMPVAPASEDLRAAINVLGGHGHWELARRLEACLQRGPAVVDILLRITRTLQADHEREELSPGVSVSDLDEARAMLADVAGVEA
jgi:glycine cleavage system regulatory protein